MDPFRKRLFNIFEFMRNVQSGFAKWYNDTFDRQGRFCANRFKSSILATNKAEIEKLINKLTKKIDYITQKTATTLSDGKHQCLHIPRDVTT